MDKALARLRAHVIWLIGRETPWAGWPARFRVIGRTR